MQQSVAEFCVPLLARERAGGTKRRNLNPCICIELQQHIRVSRVNSCMFKISIKNWVCLKVARSCLMDSKELAGESEGDGERE